MGFFAELFYMFFPGPHEKGLNTIYMILDELKRPGKDHVRAVEKAWKQLLRRCAKDNVQTPARKEFVAGIELVTRNIIRFFEFSRSVMKDNFDKVSMVIVDVYRKAIEEELDLTEEEPAKQGPVADLDGVVYRGFILTLLDEVLGDVEETLA